MIDWNAVFETLPGEFTLDVISAHETAREKPRAYLRQVVVRWSKEGRIKPHRSGHLPENLIPKTKKPDGHALIDAMVVFKPLPLRLR